MRKIEAQMIDAVYNHKDWHNSNTEVRINGAHAMVFLHGNHIATMNRADRCLELHSHGYLWHSRTTFSRLNALTRQFCGFTALYSKKNVAYLSRKVGDREWQYQDYYSFNAV